MNKSNTSETILRIAKGNPPVDTPPHFKDNDGDGGESPMAKYVTHEEL